MHAHDCGLRCVQLKKKKKKKKISSSLLCSLRSLLASTRCFSFVAFVGDGAHTRCWLEL